MRIKIFLLASLTLLADIAIGYFMIWLWFTILSPGIIQKSLIVVSLIATGRYAVGQFSWAARKMKEVSEPTQSKDYGAGQ